VPVGSTHTRPLGAAALVTHRTGVKRHRYCKPSLPPIPTCHIYAFRKRFPRAHIHTLQDVPPPLQPIDNQAALKHTPDFGNAGLPREIGCQCEGCISKKKNKKKKKKKKRAGRTMTPPSSVGRFTPPFRHHRRTSHRLAARSWIVFFCLFVFFFCEECATYMDSFRHSFTSPSTHFASHTTSTATSHSIPHDVVQHLLHDFQRIPRNGHHIFMLRSTHSTPLSTCACCFGARQCIFPDTL
jgi:hypothetical protein